MEGAGPVSDCIWHWGRVVRKILGGYSLCPGCHLFLFCLGGGRYRESLRRDEDDGQERIRCRTVTQGKNQAGILHIRPPPPVGRSWGQVGRWGSGLNPESLREPPPLQAPHTSSSRSSLKLHYCSTRSLHRQPHSARRQSFGEVRVPVKHYG